MRRRRVPALAGLAWLVLAGCAASQEAPPPPRLAQAEPQVQAPPPTTATQAQPPAAEPRRARPQQAQSPRRPAARGRRQAPRTEPPPEPPPPTVAAPAPRRDLAPVPNRDIEAPRRALREGPVLEPDVIEPRRTPGGQTFQDDQLQQRQDRLFDPAPGARLRLPFSY